MLVGATTENPYFEVNSALISRTQIYELHELGAEDIGGLLRRALNELGASVDDEVIEFLAARSGGDARASLNALGAGAGHGDAHGRARDAGRRRGRDAAQGAALRQGRRPALRLHLGLDQVHARVGPGRVAVLPGGDARGRRGRALHRPPDGDPGLRGRRQRRPAGAVGRGRGGARGRARRAAGVHVRARAGRDLPLAGAEVQRGRARRSAPPARTSARRGAASPPAALRVRRVPRGARARARPRLRLPARPPRPGERPGAHARAAARTCASTTPATPSRRCASAWPNCAGCAGETRDGRSRARERRAARDGRPIDLAAAAEAARGAQPLWSLVPASARARYIRRAAVAMLDELDDLSLRLADETGWPRAQHRALRAAAGRARAARARRRRPARARRSPRVAVRGAARRPSHAARAVAGRRRSGCAGRRRRRGPSRRSRPPPRCWPATA